MTSMKWHADPALLAAYTDGSLDAVAGASVEQHLSHCADCREAIRSYADLPALDLAWAGVRDAVETPRYPAPIRLARRLGLPDSSAVLLAATASLRTAWMVSAFVALAFATLAAILTDGKNLAPFLLVAPMIPTLGVAAAFSSHQSSLETLVVTAPYGRTRLILTRTLAVLATSLPIAILLGLLVPGPAWVAAAWLGPALTLIPVLLALSSFVGPYPAGAAVAVGWCGVVGVSVRGLPATWPVQLEQQGVYLALAVAACAVLALRAGRRTEIGALL
jgi:hypothetical protein